MDYLLDIKVDSVALSHAVLRRNTDINRLQVSRIAKVIEIGIQPITMIHLALRYPDRVNLWMRTGAYPK